MSTSFVFLLRFSWTLSLTSSLRFQKGTGTNNASRQLLTDKSIDREFNSLQIDAEFKSARDGCRWEKQKSFGAHNHSNDFFPRVYPPKILGKRDMDVRFCTVAEKPDSSWSIWHLGPYESTGGYDWHETTHILHPFSNPLLDTDVYVFASRIVLLDLNFKPYSHPPLHMHHANVAPWEESDPDEDGAGKSDTVAGSVGDLLCSEEFGGVRCQWDQRWSVMKKDTLLKSILVFNDVREKNSKPISMFAEIALNWRKKSANEKIKQVFFLHLINPWFSSNWAHTGTYPAPVNRASVYWYSYKQPFSGAYKEFRTHTHAGTHGATETWLYRASESDLGFAELTKDLTLFPWEAYVPSVYGRTLHEIKNYVWENYESSKAACATSATCPTLICKFKGPMQEYVQGDPENGIIGKFYDRSSPTSLGKECLHRAQKDDIFTSVWFSQGIENNTDDTIVYLSTNHAHFHSYIEPDEPDFKTEERVGIVTGTRSGYCQLAIKSNANGNGNAADNSIFSLTYNTHCYARHADMKTETYWDGARFVQGKSEGCNVFNLQPSATLLANKKIFCFP